jgi:RNA 2',3'-cyclic 3'-phosphodiesterase
VTLLFLGNVTDGQALALKQAAALISIPPITLYFDQLRYWKKPRILCLTATQANQDLNTLVDGLAALAKMLEIPLDDRPFQAHVTLARAADNVAKLDFAPVLWQSTAFCLVESCTVMHKVEYRMVECWDSVR